ncbi:MAG: NADPH:quinone oxidoreductase family protein [Myxococcota bacterium]
MSYGPPGRRVVVQAFGETPLDAVDRHVVVEEQAPPDPSGLGPRDVVVAVRSAAVGWVDLLMTSGQYQHMPSPPYCPGMEYSGEVVWTGPDVDPGDVAVGDPVMADGLLTGPRSGGDYQRWGGFASYAVAPAEALRPLPASFTWDQGACFLGSYETAWHCLVHCGALQAGETVLIHGASGTTGLAAVHVAKILGATVIATGRSPDKLEVVRSQGADHVLPIADDEGGVRRFRDDVKALTGDRGVDVVYDGVGGDVSLESLRCVRFGARFLVVGWAATPFVARGRGRRGAPNANVLPTNLIMMKGLHVMGCPTVIATQHDPGIRVERLAGLASWVEQGLLRPHVSEAFPMSRVREALRAKWRSRCVGACVLHPSG